MRRLAIVTLFQESNFQMWVILATVLVILFFIVMIIVVGVTILFIARKRSQAKPVTAAVSPAGVAGSGAAKLTPSYGGPTPPSESAMAASAPASYSPSPGARSAAASESAPRFGPAAADKEETVDLSRTLAITPASNTAPISYGSIKFVSGALAGQEFDIAPDGACIGRDSALSQIVLADPRISKRHVWIGVRDGRVTIADQGSRNGTFVNDPKSDRVTEVSLKDGDMVILGESDVARFEYRE